MSNQIHFINRKIIFGILIFIFLAILSTLIMAQESIIPGEKYLNRFSLSNDIIEKNPILEKNIFSSQDEKVVAWFQFSYNSQEDFNLYWEWINPEGKLHHRGVVKMEAGNYQGYRTWYWISIKKRYSATSFPGEWKVKIFINEKFVSEKTFYIINSEK